MSKKSYRVVATGLEFPEGPIAMSDGSIVLVEIKRGTLTRVLPNGTQEIVADLGGGPNGIAIGPGGKCFVCNNGGFLAIKRDLELCHKPGDAALVAALHGDDIRAGGEQLGDVGAVIVVPVVSGERGFAVHEQGEAVITGSLEFG